MVRSNHEVRSTEPKSNLIPTKIPIFWKSKSKQSEIDKKIFIFGEEKFYKTRLKMLFRSKTAIRLRLQRLFNTKYSSKSFSILTELLQSNETQKFSAIATKLSNNYNAEQNDKNLSNVY